MILSLFCLRQKLYLKKKKIQRHIFSCCESLECHRSNSPAGLTCFVGKEKVELANTPEQYNQIRKLRNLSICLLCSPSLPPPQLFFLLFFPVFQAVCFTSWAKMVSSQTCLGVHGECYLSVVMVPFCIINRTCLGNWRISAVKDGKKQEGNWTMSQSSIKSSLLLDHYFWSILLPEKSVWCLMVF